ncbi:MAG: tetratricopeptide repeat protein [Chthoniobacterales bacterium]
MKFPWRCLFVAAILLALVRPNASGATDPEIDRLLKKLPPPEKLVKVNEHVFHPNDPALQDPLGKEIGEASRKKDFKRSLALSRQLAVRYPSSAVAHTFSGLFALVLGRFPEASASFHRALAIQPQLTFDHYCLAGSEWGQHHFAVALQHLREVTKLEPQAALGWGTLSLYAQAAGARQESVSAAKRLTTLEPHDPAAWERLASAEKSAGNLSGAAYAMDRAAKAAHEVAAKNSAAKKKR